MFNKKKNKKRIIRPNLESRRISKKQPSQFKRFFLKTFFYIFLLAFLASVPYAIFGRNYLTINGLAISGINLLSQDEIRSKIEDKFSGSWLNVIPKNNLIYPWQKIIANELMVQYPLIKEIEVIKKYPHDLIVHITERVPAVILSSKEGNCVYDQEGEKFDKLNKSEDVYWGEELKVIEKLKGDEFSDCANQLDKKYIDFLTKFSQRLNEDLSFQLKNLWKTPNLASGDLRVETIAGWGVFLDQSLGWEQEMEMLKLIFQNKLTEEEKNNLEYIDLRTLNRVYYKVRGVSENKEENISEGENIEKKDD